MAFVTSSKIGTENGTRLSFQMDLTMALHEIKLQVPNRHSCLPRLGRDRKSFDLVTGYSFLLQEVIIRLAYVPDRRER